MNNLLCSAPPIRKWHRGPTVHFISVLLMLKIKHFLSQFQPARNSLTLGFIAALIFLQNYSQKKSVIHEVLEVIN